MSDEKKDAIVKAIKDKSVAEKVYSKITELEKNGGLDLPDNYSAGNALKSAWLIFQSDSKLMNCTDSSKANALLDMVIQGLSPSKKQCYFIPYGNEAQLQRSYQGNVAVTKRLKEVKDIFAQVIYDGDEVSYEIVDGVTKIKEHKQSFENIDVTKIKGAYAIVFTSDDKKVGTIMTMDQIRAAWEQGAMKGNSPAHKKFTDEMAKKSVINRACKYYFNTSDDSDILVESVNRTQSVDDMPDEQYEEVIDNQVDEHQATKEIDVQVEEPEDVEEVKEGIGGERKAGFGEDGTKLEPGDKVKFDEQGPGF